MLIGLSVPRELDREAALAQFRPGEGAVALAFDLYGLKYNEPAFRFTPFPGPFEPYVPVLPLITGYSIEDGSRRPW